MNTLRRYLEENDESLSAFAVRIGKAPSTLTRVLSGERNPSIGLAREIEKGTAGKVTAAEFMAICLQTQEAAE
jgi:transcriptional regulator with XRE-family HTH domain